MILSNDSDSGNCNKACKNCIINLVCYLLKPIPVVLLKIKLFPESFFPIGEFEMRMRMRMNAVDRKRKKIKRKN
uniref:Uncharacterized protein n=1 Tax=Cannabis sativa TaxID=3483 RepID=A0A803R3U8_CANSA